MTENEAIHLLRRALCIIWTELDRVDPDLDGCWEIINEAITLTRKFANPKILNGPDATGLEEWHLYLASKNIKPPEE